MATKKNAKKRARKTIKFVPEDVIAQYKAGKSVSEIALAAGYPPNQGNNRVRYTLEKAGIYKAAKPGRPARKKTTTKTTAQPAAATPAAAAAPATGMIDSADTALRVCLKTAEVSMANLGMDDATRVSFAKTLMGALAANYGITDFHLRRPIMVIDENRVKPYLVAAMATA